MVKHKANNTQRRASSFTSQVALRNFESIMVHCAYSCICEKVGDFKIHEWDNDNEVKGSSCFTITFGVSPDARRREDRPHQVKWLDDKKNKLGRQVNKNFIDLISRTCQRMDIIWDF